MGKEERFILEGGTAEIIEKKSRFIAQTAPAATEEEARQFIERIRKEHWNARHNCFAFAAGGEQRFSDDGEPAQTAGKPILDVLLGADIRDGVIVVTRYFGGVLLGTGGLVRAYSRAAAEGLAASRIAVRRQGFYWELDTDYNSAGKITYLFGKEQIPVLNSEYGQSVKLEVIIPAEDAHRIRKTLMEITSGSIIFEQEKEQAYAEADGRIYRLAQ